MTSSPPCCSRPNSEPAPHVNVPRLVYEHVYHVAGEDRDGNRRLMYACVLPWDALRLAGRWHAGAVR